MFQATIGLVIYAVLTIEESGTRFFRVQPRRSESLQMSTATFHLASFRAPAPWTVDNVQYCQVPSSPGRGRTKMPYWRVKVEGRIEPRSGSDWSTDAAFYGDTVSERRSTRACVIIKGPGSMW